MASELETQFELQLARAFASEVTRPKLALVTVESGTPQIVLELGPSLAA